MSAAAITPFMKSLFVYWQHGQQTIEDTMPDFMNAKYNLGDDSTAYWFVDEANSVTHLSLYHPFFRLHQIFIVVMKASWWTPFTVVSLYIVCWNLCHSFVILCIPSSLSVSLCWMWGLRYSNQRPWSSTCYLSLEGVFLLHFTITRPCLLAQASSRPI